jgi:hypothetical protein
MKSANTGSNNWEVGNRKNTLRLGLWTLAWVLSTALMAFGPRLIWDFATAPTLLAVLLNLAVGFGMILANRRQLRGLDEMQQKIFFEAGALTLGVGLVCGISYDILEDVKLIAFEPKIAHLVILMGLTFLVGMILGQRKYR